VVQSFTSLRIWSFFQGYIDNPKFFDISDLFARKFILENSCPKDHSSRPSLLLFQSVSDSQTVFENKPQFKLHKDFSSRFFLKTKVPQTSGNKLKVV
jgi:hypothetical protein